MRFHATVVAIVVAVWVSGNTAYGVDLYPTTGTRSGNVSRNPGGVTTWQGLKELLADADHILTTAELNVIDDDNGVYYIDSTNDYEHVFIAIKIPSASQIHDYTCYWEAYHALYPYSGMSIWVWDPRPYAQGGECWVLKDVGPTGIWTTARSFALHWRYFYFDDEEDQYLCRLLIQGDGWPDWFKVDIVKVNY